MRFVSDPPILSSLDRWWNSLAPGERVFAPILFANVLVFAAWKVPSLQATMLRYFACNPAAPVRCLTMLTSTFSHYNAIHLLCNMYVLHSFSSTLVNVMGKEQFVGFYLSAGVISSFFSSVIKVCTCFKRGLSYKKHRSMSQVARGASGYSLGASGAILGLIGVFGSVYPDMQMQVGPFLSLFVGR